MGDGGTCPSPPPLSTSKFAHLGVLLGVGCLLSVLFGVLGAFWVLLPPLKTPKIWSPLKDLLLTVDHKKLNLILNIKIWFTRKGYFFYHINHCHKIRKLVWVCYNSISFWFFFERHLMDQRALLKLAIFEHSMNWWLPQQKWKKVQTSLFTWHFKRLGG